MTTPISTLLTNLGNTADEVAAKLTAAGVTGTLNEPNSCAIARYLEAEGFEDVAVLNCPNPTTRYDDWFQVEAHADNGYVIGATGPVADFIRAFDREEYPHLIAGSS
jgi:hypothetical protein